MQILQHRDIIATIAPRGGQNPPALGTSKPTFPRQPSDPWRSYQNCTAIVMVFPRQLSGSLILVSWSHPEGHSANDRLWHKAVVQRRQPERLLWGAKRKFTASMSAFGDKAAGNWSLCFRLKLDTVFSAEVDPTRSSIVLSVLGNG